MNSKTARRLVVYIAAAYLGQGVSQHFCLPAQPLDNYLLRACSWDAAQIASYMALLMIPWTIKPVFALLADCLPCFSSKRNILALAFGVASVSYLAAGSLPAASMAIFLVLSSAGMACASAVLLGLVVERFAGEVVPYVVSLQNFAYYLALMFAGLLAGALCQNLQPDVALSSSLTISALVCAVLALTSFCFLDDSSVDRERRLDSVFEQLKQMIFQRQFQLVALFIFCWTFSPGFGVPLYIHYTKVLHMSQSTIGQANSCNAVGMLVGTLAYALLWHLVSARAVLLSIWTCVASTLAFIWVRADNASLLEFVRGVTTMLAALSMNSIVASACPAGLETIASALLISVHNIGTQSSSIIGAHLYAHVFRDQLNPLLIISASTTAFCTIQCTHFSQLLVIISISSKQEQRWLSAQQIFVNISRVLRKYLV